MTAFASIVLAALPGVGAKSGADGLAMADAKGTAGQGPAGAFEALMASLIDGAAAPADAPVASAVPLPLANATLPAASVPGLADGALEPAPVELDVALLNDASAAEALAAAGVVSLAPLPQPAQATTDVEPATPAAPASTAPGLAGPRAPDLATETASAPAERAVSTPVSPQAVDAASSDVFAMLAAGTDSPPQPPLPARPVAGALAASQPSAGLGAPAADVLASLTGRVIDRARTPETTLAEPAASDAASARESSVEGLVDSPVELALETALSPEAPVPVEAAVVETPTVPAPASGRRPARAESVRVEALAASLETDGPDLTAAPRVEARPAADAAPAPVARPEAAAAPALTADLGDEAAPATLDTAPAAATPQATAELPVEATPTRGSPETVARLAADIAQKLEGKTTRFDVQLDPLGLGKVDVSIEINADGRLSASLSFDSAQTAADLRGRAGELRQALEKAGFDLADGGLTFDMNNPGGSGGREARETLAAWSSRAFDTARTGLEQAEALAVRSPWSRAPSRGVDIRI